MSLWPFRVGNDDRFLTSADRQQETIYESLQDVLPPNRYSLEVDKYLEWRWRRGVIQNVFPTACYGAIAGFIVGFRQSHVEGRYIGRYKVMWRYTSTFATVGLLTTAVHHYMVVRNDYHDTFYYPILSGTTGATVLTVMVKMGTVGQGVFAGTFVGVLYALGCYAQTAYHRRHMLSFLRQQQLQQVPIHRVSPELQPMYRAFLYDHRPLEDREWHRREAILLSRGADDVRLDAVTFMHNMTPDIFDWVNFPDWWPLKWPVQSEEAQMMLDRQRDEEITRRAEKILESEDGALLKRKNRFKKYQDE